MGIFREKDLSEQILNARIEEAELTEKKLKIKFEKEKKDIESEYILKNASLEAEVKRLNSVIDEMQPYIKEASEKLLKANEESLKTKILTTKLKNAAEIVMNNQASVVRPFLKAGEDIEKLNKKLLGIDEEETG